MIRKQLSINNLLCWQCDPQSHLLDKKERNPSYQSEIHMTRTCMTQGVRLSLGKRLADVFAEVETTGQVRM